MAEREPRDLCEVPAKKPRTESVTETSLDSGCLDVPVNSETSSDLPEGSQMKKIFMKKIDTSSSDSNTDTGIMTEEDSGNISDTSSHASSGDWQPRPTGIMSWVHSQMLSGADPRDILLHLVPGITDLPSEIGSLSLWKLIVSLLSEPQRRQKIPQINTLRDVVELIKKSKNIVVLTGAGVSVSCGIPDFRSRDGVYRRLAVDFPDLPDPQAMFDIHYFTKDPRPFFKFAKEIYPGQFKPSLSHRFISMLERMGHLLRNYTQNIDTLEQVAGITKIVQCHGSFATASCLKCHYKVDCEAIRKNIFDQTVPRCLKCPPETESAIMKPDIVFFGESLGEDFHKQMTKDKEKADLLIVIGSSMKVRPVALIPSSIPSEIPQILINREPLPHLQFDVELLGDGDSIVAEICRRLGNEFTDLGNETEALKEIHKLPGDDVSGKNSNGTETELVSSKSLQDKSENIPNMSDAENSNSTAETSNKVEQDAPKIDGQSSDPISNKKIEPELNKDEASNEDETLKNLWRSRWKQSISKRLPDGTFYYGGASRYIFPGAEVAPEEEDDSDISDIDSSPSSPNKESDEDSETEVLAPGGLSSTRRNLRTSSIPFQLPNSCLSEISSAVLGGSCCTSSCAATDTETISASTDLPNSNSTVHDSETKMSLKTCDLEPVIPLDLHDLLEMENLPKNEFAESDETKNNLQLDPQGILASPIKADAVANVETVPDTKVTDLPSFHSTSQNHYGDGLIKSSERVNELPSDIADISDNPLRMNTVAKSEVSDAKIQNLLPSYCQSHISEDVPVDHSQF